MESMGNTPNSGNFFIGKRGIGKGHPAWIVADVAQAHDGSLGTAHAFIDIASRAGVDAIKFQTHLADAESSSEEPFRVHFSRQDSSRYEYWRRMEFSPEQWHGLAVHARENGLEFLSTPFSVEAADLLEKIGVAAWKVGSGDITNNLLLDRLIASKKPILLSSGMSSWGELDAAVTLVKRHVPCMVYQCTTQYPCPPKLVGLGLIKDMMSRYQLPIGLSDHSGKTCFGIAAVAIGAASVEVHIAMSRESFGPDVPASLVPHELQQLVEGVRNVEEAIATPLDKDALSVSFQDMKAIFGRSLVTKLAIKRGQMVKQEYLTAKKPAIGIPPSAIDEVVGRKVRRDLPANHFITMEDIE